MVATINAFTTVRVPNGNADAPPGVVRLMFILRLTKGKHG